jgi:prepilin signal peptidase PulO-like enzyme (type II secretory pathway)
MLQVILILIVVGFALGSFTNALTWRLHEQEEQRAKRPSRKRTEYLKELSVTTGRSMCPHCHHRLAAKDLIPLFSWLQLLGKCRYCKHSIGWQYPLVESLTAGLFIVSYLWWPSGFHGAGIIEFVCWLICLVGFMALAVYDIKWYLLPDKIVYPLFALAAVQVLVTVLGFHAGVHTLLGSIWGVLIDGGLFYILFQVSGGQWIGGGDVKLGAVLGVIIGGPLTACLLLFVASLSGTLVSLPLMTTGKAKRTSYCWLLSLYDSSVRVS